MVEFAIVVPLMFLLLLIALDFGRLFFTYVSISNAAREGAAYAAGLPNECGGNPCLPTSGIAKHASQETSSQNRGGGATAIQVRATCANSAGVTISCASATTGGGVTGNTVTVQTKQPFLFYTPMINSFFGSNLSLSASASAVVNGYATGGGGGPPPGSCSLPVPSFTVTVTSGLTVFADPSASTPNSGVCNISGYNWSWDPDPDHDTVGSATGDAHTYPSPGTYVITLEVTNQAGAATTTRSITVPVGPPPPTCALPVANFDWTIPANKTYAYRDRSTVADPVNCPITDWLWTFHDEGSPPLQSNAQNPANVVYGNNSSHPVTLRVTNAAGSTTITKNS